MKMPYERHHFVGVLANVDETVRNVSFVVTPPPNRGTSDEIQIHTWQLDDLATFLGKLDYLPPHEFRLRMTSKYRCVTAHGVYVLEGNTWLPRPWDERYPPDVERDVRRGEEEVAQRLRRHVERMKLFKDSSVELVMLYFLQGTPVTPLWGYAEAAPPLSETDILTLTPDEVVAFTRFQSSVTLPFERDYVRLAYEHFLQSFSVEDYKLKYLLLMISLEILFNDGRQELQYRVSRAVAVLLSTNQAEGAMLLKRIKRLYGVRSTLVHAGTSASFGFDDVRELRSVVRRCILGVHAINLGKDDLAQLLTAHGFGTIANAT